MMDPTYLLDCGDPCSNIYFNNVIQANDEYSLNIIHVFFEYDLHNAENWKGFKGEETIQFHYGNNVLYYAAVQFSIDASKRTHKSVSRNDTHER